jgi:hypothetical protein
MDLATQKEHLERLRAELERLNRACAECKTVMGVKDDAELEVAAMTPDLSAMMQEARLQAERDSRQAVACLNADATTSAAPKRARRCAINI